MTIPVEFAKRWQRVEYFVTIEGIGWSVNGLKDITAGFEGRVWATNDLDGDLATILGATVNRGLELPRSISDSVDPRTGEYKLSGCDFEISDRGGWWAANYTPRKEGVTTALYGSTSADHLLQNNHTIKLMDGTNFAASSVCWIGGRECVKLGTKVIIGGGPSYTYSNSTRGYLGTQQGSSLRRAEDYTFSVWPFNTSVSNIARWYWNRKVALWAHIPGEAVENCYLLWYGFLRGITQPATGERWSFSCVGDVLHCINRIWRPRSWYISHDTVAPQDAAGTMAAHDPNAQVWQASEGMRRQITFATPAGSDLSLLNEGLYTLAAAYNYRNEPGGTSGMVSGWLSGTVQAVDTPTDNDLMESFCAVGSDVIRLLKRDDANGNTQPYKVLAEMISRVGTTPVGIAYESSNGRLAYSSNPEQNLSYAAGSAARFLLDNWSTVREISRFVVDGTARNNVIDVALIFLTSMDTELAVRAVNAGATSTVIPVKSPGLYTADKWVGKALFVMSGTYRWESRTIISNTTNAVTVERAFSGAPAEDVEVQIRNSIYDVLPLGWGLGVDTDYLDVASLETIRDHYLADAKVDRFILGTENEIDLWRLLMDNIFRPYGVQLYLDRSTRKLTGRYLVNTPNLDEIEDYITITTADLAEPGTINHHFANPVGSVSLKVRALLERYTRAIHVSGAIAGFTKEIVAALFGATTDVITVRSAEIENAFAENDLDKLETQAMFNTRENVAPLMTRLYGMIAEYSLPPPVWDTSWSIRVWSDMYSGQLVEFDWPTVPTNSFTGVRGWSGLVGRVLSTTLPLDGKSLAFRVSVELMAMKTRGVIAPAAIVTGKGNDGVVDYFEVEDTNFVGDPDNGDLDWGRFVVGDLIQLRDATGANKEDETIHSFGSNRAATVALAADSRVNVVGAIGSAIASGDNIAYKPWSAANTTNMEKHSAFADTAGALTGGDSSRRYL